MGPYIGSKLERSGKVPSRLCEGVGVSEGTVPSSETEDFFEVANLNDAIWSRGVTQDPQDVKATIFKLPFPP